MKGYRRKIYMGITIISLGVVLNQVSAKGSVLIGVGGLFFISGMNGKKMFEKDKDNDQE